MSSRRWLLTNTVWWRRGSFRRWDGPGRQSPGGSATGTSTGFTVASTPSATPRSPSAAGGSAVLACGCDAALSYHAAGALWELRAAPTGPIDVTALGRRSHPGIRCHIARTLDPRDHTTIDGIPVTSLNRTLLDLAEVLSPQRLRSMLEAAQRRDLINPEALNALLARSPGRRGVKPLRAALALLHDEAPWTQSELERRFLELIRTAGLPEPQANVVVEGFVVDFFWPVQRLVVEVDGYRFHKTKRSFEEDRQRDATLQIAAVRVLRVTHQRIAAEANALLDDLHRLLRLGSATR